MNVEEFEIIDEKNDKKASLTAVQLVSSGKADMVMKGLSRYSYILKSCIKQRSRT